MSRIAKWKLEKTKVKVVFRLQFHATHIPQTGWDKLFVSFIPADSGKATAKTTKANVKNGTCKWSDPIYETTRLLQDAKTKQFDEKLYKLVVAMGSSRSSLLGEANINLADYADAAEPSSVTMPLHGCNSGAVLHVTVQLLTSKTGFREFEQQRELRERVLHTTTGQNICEEPAGRISASTETANDQMHKVNARVRFKSESRELPSLEEVVELNEEYADSAAGFDGSSNTSESLCAEKHDTSSTHEIDSIKSTISGDLCGLSLGQSPQPEKGDPSDPRLLAHGSNDWVHGWSSDYSADNDLATVYEENSRLRGSLEVAESSILELKLEVSSLQSHTDELGVETHKFSRQLAAEIVSGEELEKEVSVLKSECSKFKDELEQLKIFRLNPHLTSRESTEIDQDHMLEDLQLRWLQGLLIMEDKVREIQNKACLRYHERDFGFLHPDIEALQCVLHDLKRGTTQVSSLLNVATSERETMKEVGAMNAHKLEQFVPRDGLEGFDSDQYHSEGVHCLSRPGMVPQEPDHINVTNVMEDKICELVKELENSKAERENLARKMDQMECYYEALIQELEESQKQMLGELQNLRNEHSTCLYTISSCKTQMEVMHQDMNEQILRFADDRRDLDSLNKELERRAVASETALKRARCNYSIAVDQLQKDLELLSFQVLSMFETNENLIRQTFDEASQPCFQEYLETAPNDNASFLQEHYKSVQEYQTEVDVSQKAEQELASDQVLPLQKILSEKKNLAVHADLVAEARRNLVGLDFLSSTKDELPGNCTLLKSKLDSQESDTAKLLPCQNQNAELKKHPIGGEVLLEDLKKSFHLQEELYRKAEDELCEVYVVNIHLDVFSKTLQETLHDTSDGVRLMKEKMDELGQQLVHSTKSKELLMLRLQTTLDELDILSKDKASCITKCNDLALQNQSLEAKLEGVSSENCLLTQKIMKCEMLMMECRSYQSNYEACTVEKAELANLLKQETLEKCSLQNEVGSLHEELKSIGAEFDKLASVKDGLEKNVTFLQDKLGGLMSTMVSYNEQLNGPSLYSKSLQRELENTNCMSTILHLEELQKKACEKILQLTQEKNDMEEEKDTGRRSLCKAELEIKVMKQKFESDIQDMVTKLDVSNAHVEKLQLELEGISNKLKASSEAEEKYLEQKRELFSNFAVLEVELQRVTTENKDFAQRILALESVNEELERTKLTVFDFTRENQALMMSLKAGDEEAVNLATELSSVKESLRCIHDELHFERGFRAELEGTVTDLTSQLNEKHDQLLSFDKQKAELDHLKQLASDLELEKSRECRLLVHNEESLKKADEDASSLCQQVTDLETHLAEMYEYLLVADVELIFTRNQFETWMQKLVQQLESLDEYRGELHLKHLDVLTTLNSRIASEAQYVDENARLLTALDSLRSELEASIAQKRVLLDKNNAMSAELEECMNKAAIAEVSHTNDKHLHELEVEQLKRMLVSSEEEIDNLKFSRDELEIMVIVLKGKLDEQGAQISLLEEYNDERMMLRNQHNDLTCRLSEQMLKTEEFKNLSIHLKGLKDEAEVECLQARGKKETEGASVAMQESLRIAFIREQCETKLQELKSQLYISKKHAEEMLLKLQDALDEVENRKKSEASHVKRNEELSLKILELETELQMILSDRREKINAYDRMKAELECSSISLDCFKEEKQKLEASLQECNQERSRIAINLKLMKERQESSKSPINIQVEGNYGSCIRGYMSSEPVTEKVEQEALIAGGLSHRTDMVPANDLSENHRSKSLDQDFLLSCNEVEVACPGPFDGSKHSLQQMNLQSFQDILVSKRVVGISSEVLHGEGLLQNNLAHVSLINDHFKAQSLKSSMDHLHKELERMKNENFGSLLPQDEYHFDPSFQGLQRELLQLHKVNEQLGSIFPLFNEFPGSGNALERVLALELELAEALQAKKKSNIHFQSSFLKQHSDEEAVFQSFRDINELIKDMLELKGRYTAVETELKEMHDRYSQLSLQFAEVEGERQKLVMTLKNVRVPRKNSNLNHSTSASFEDRA